MCVFKGVSHSSALSEKATPISKDSPSGPRCLSIASLKQFQGASADKFSELASCFSSFFFIVYCYNIGELSFEKGGGGTAMERERLE